MSFAQKVASATLISIMLMVITVACVTNRETKRKQFIVVSDAQMNAMGATSYAEMRQKEKIASNRAWTEAVVDIGKRIARASGRDYQWEFTLFDAQDINAWCLPGGKVGVYTGIMPVAATNAGLAAVMGHEIAHAVLRHGAERVSQSLVVSGVMLTLDQALRDDQRKPFILAALGLGAQMGVVLPFSRKQEAEADTVGLEYMAKAGFDPAEAVTLWQRMAQASGPRLPEFLSTHPDSLNRSRALAGQLAKVRPLYDASVKVSTQKL